MTLSAPPRPAFRGVLHLVAAMLAPVGLAVLLLIAGSPSAYVGAAIFATTLMLLYASSASYHLAPWPAGPRRIMKRVDHSMIFVLIAGTYTPFCLVVLDPAWGIPMLAVVWSLAAVGALTKIAWPDTPRWLSVSLYVGLGWVGVVAVAPLIGALPATALALVLAGGLAYTLGAAIYAARWPDPLPRIFGYHEVFHSLVVTGSGVHFAVIAAFVLR